MDHVPRIEVHNWNTQPSLHSPSWDDDGGGDVSPLDCLSVQSTLLDGPRNNLPPATITYYSVCHREMQPPPPPPPPKPRRFWSHFRRSKSDHGCYGGGDDDYSSPQPAMRGGRLIRSPEQQNASSSSNQRHLPLHHPHEPRAKLNKKNNDNNNTRPRPRARAVSATTPRKQASSGGRGPHGENNKEAELLSAQLLPGHYSLSVYDYVGDGSLQQSSESLDTLATGISGSSSQDLWDTPAADPDVDAGEGGEDEPSGPWMSLALKLTSRGPFR